MREPFWIDGDSESGRNGLKSTREGCRLQFEDIAPRENSTWTDARFGSSGQRPKAPPEMQELEQRVSWLDFWLRGLST